MKTVSRGRILQAPLQFHHPVNKFTSVKNEMSDRSGIRTYPSEDTAAFTQLLRTLGHPACKIKYKPTFVFVQGLYPFSRASLEVIAFCNLSFHGFYYWLKVNSPVCYESCMHVTYAFLPLLCLSMIPFKSLGRSPGNGRCLLCYFLAYTVWQTFNFGNNIELVAPCDLMMTFVNGSLWRHLCFVVRV